MKRTVYILLAMLIVQSALAQEATFHFTDGIYNTALKEKMEQKASALLTEINKAARENRSLNLSGITLAEASARLNRTWENFGFVCQSNAKSICYSLTNGYQARGIRATVTRQPADCKDSKDRELTISFDGNGDITRVGFALQNNRLLAINKGAEVYDIKRRNEILKFVEDFRNYYIEKDIASLRQIYSDDALIITGKVTYTRDEGGDYSKRIKKRTKYTLQDKETYLNKLEQLFRANKYIDVQFDDIMISQSNSESMPNYYGVNLIQHWKTDRYSDVGYLFLLWDFNEEPPVIHVRAWQPQDIADDEFIMIDDFR